VIHGSTHVDSRDPHALAQLIPLRIGDLEPGDYLARVTARQGNRTVEESTTLHVRPWPKESGAVAQLPSADSGDGDAPSDHDSSFDTSSSPIGAAQERLIAQARDAAMRYSQKLPNFMCTQVTRRQLDPKGRGDWRLLDEKTQMIMFFDGREHYADLRTRSRATGEREVPTSALTTGEFGSLLKQIFEPDSHATFGWKRTDNVRGRSVHVLTYEVPAAYSKYLVSYSHGQQRVPLFSGYRGLLFVDSDTGAVYRLTHETVGLPPEVPMRQIGVVIDYDYAAVGGQLYLLPLSASVEVRHRKNTIIRNEVTFRSYQRYATDSRIVSYGPAQ